MTEPDTYSYPRYLTAKRTVDARALNERVWTQFVERIAEQASPVRVLEVGGGVGATVQRIVDALEPRVVDALRYTIVDIQSENIETARAALHDWAEDRGYSVSGGQTQAWTGGPLDVSVEFQTADLFDLAASHDGPLYDAVAAQAVFDLLPIPDAHDALAPLLAPGGLWYLPIHFDGVTAFEPPVEADLDARVERLFHESMNDAPDQPGRSGAHCGRRLLTHFQGADDSLLEAGASDWVVLPEGEAYPGDEAYFLHHILHFVETELTGHPDLDADAFAEWMATRRRQVEAGELTYIAHQLDVLAQKG
ncbi:MAG: class I SAM-dependent methyltransferase [Bacteroidetes bacterium SW_9_63_38]|nr:MAG: class I SAM-dependent methyltransferase [Bacteroidetes bacterium SW_9_63_38]